MPATSERTLSTSRASTTSSSTALTCDAVRRIGAVVGADVSDSYGEDVNAGGSGGDERFANPPLDGALLYPPFYKALRDAVGFLKESL